MAVDNKKLMAAIRWLPNLVLNCGARLLPDSYKTNVNEDSRHRFKRRAAILWVQFAIIALLATLVATFIHYLTTDLPASSLTITCGSIEGCEREYQERTGRSFAEAKYSGASCAYFIQQSLHENQFKSLSGVSDSTAQTEYDSQKEFILLRVCTKLKMSAWEAFNLSWAAATMLWALVICLGPIPLGLCCKKHYHDIDEKEMGKAERSGSNGQYDPHADDHEHEHDHEDYGINMTNVHSERSRLSTSQA